MEVRICQAGLETPEMHSARTIVIYDKFEQPVIVVAEHGDNIILTTAKEKEFSKILSSLGVGLNAQVKVVSCKNKH